jgi:hypothetical protein
MSSTAVAHVTPSAAVEQAKPGAFMNLVLEELRNPADLGFPPMMPMELALKIDTPVNVCKAYGISRQQFAAIIAHPVFIKKYQEAIEALKVEGMSFKVKAKMQAEDFLTTVYAMVKNPGTSDAVRADLIKNTVRWAGFDAKAVDAGGGNAFNIQINLG